jgi:hypothetical protein
VLPAFVNDPFAWVSRVRPFSVPSPDRWQTEGPLDLSSPGYAADFNEVKAKGALNGSTRTPAETELARFVTANPLLFMHQGFRDIGQRAG